MAQTACDTKFSFSYDTESTVQQLYIPYGVSTINVKLWGAGGASAKSNRDRRSNVDTADSSTLDRSVDISTLSSKSDSHQGRGYDESRSSTMHYCGQGGNYFSSNISVSMNQNIWVVVGKGGRPAVDVHASVDASARTVPGGRSAVQLVLGSDEVSASGGEAGRVESHRVDSRDGTKSHLSWDAAYSRARGDTEVQDVLRCLLLLASA